MCFFFGTKVDCVSQNENTALRFFIAWKFLFLVVTLDDKSGFQKRETERNLNLNILQVI